MEKIIMTSEGFARLKKQLSEWKKKKKELVEEMELARQEGDLKENAAYHQLRDTVSLLTQQIEELEGKLKRAKIVAPVNGKNDKVGIGSIVSLEIAEEKKEFKIVGDGEGRVENGEISYRSPWGKALLGKKKGERVVIEVPAGRIEAKIVDVK